MARILSNLPWQLVIDRGCMVRTMTNHLYCIILNSAAIEMYRGRGLANVIHRALSDPIEMRRGRPSRLV